LLYLSIAIMASYSSGDGVDLSQYPTAKKLVDKCVEFFDEVQNLFVPFSPLTPISPTHNPSTPGAPLEARLNATYGPTSHFHKTFTSLIRQGIKNDEGWCATIPIAGAHYRRSKIAVPSELTRYFSITTVYMDSSSMPANSETLRGQYHQHPYGEINCVITLEDDSAAELRGMNGWQGAGWTSPGAGTHHYPEVRGGALVALFFLPAGRISYEVSPGMPQPASL
jgi:Domain of unknown function (DUF4863)